MSTMTRTRSLSVLLLLLLAAALLLAGCGSSDDSGGSDSTSDDTSESTADSNSADSASTDDVTARDGAYDAPPTLKLDPKKTYTVRVKTSKGSFDIKVDPKAAPLAAANFVFLVKEGFYDGVVFHRILKDFMVQTGDPAGTGMGGPGYSIKDDPVKGDYERGTVAMANAGPDTGGSQFFIVHGSTVDQTLPKDYVIFGSVDDAGMKTIDKIAAVEVQAGPTGEPSQPVEPVTIESATLL